MSARGTLRTMEQARFRYQWLIFDADGTLFDFHQGETTALQLTTQNHGFEYSSHLHQVYKEISAQLWGQFELGEITLQDLRVTRFDRLFSELEINVEPESFNPISWRIWESRRNFCQVPRRPSEICLRVSNSCWRPTALRWSSARVLRIPRSESIFEDIVISDEIGVAKPQIGLWPRRFRGWASRRGQRS